MLENNLWDLAVGRDYYTMFYIAQAFLLSKNLSFSTNVKFHNKKFSNIFLEANLLNDDTYSISFIRINIIILIKEIPLLSLLLS